MPNGNGNDRITTLSFQKKQSALSNIQTLINNIDYYYDYTNKSTSKNKIINTLNELLNLINSNEYQSFSYSTRTPCYDLVGECGTDYILGDFNQDTSVNVLDVVGLMDGIIDDSLTDEQICITDLNFDNNVDILDIVSLIDNILNETNPPCPSLCIEGEEVELYGQCYNIDDTEFLNLSNSGLTGEIPEQICDLIYLESIDLSNNELIGSFPICLGNMRNDINEIVLQEINVQNNKLSTTIPASICNLFDISTVSGNDYNDGIIGEGQFEIEDNNFCLDDLPWCFGVEQSPSQRSCPTGLSEDGCGNCCTDFGLGPDCCSISIGLTGGCATCPDSTLGPEYVCPDEITSCVTNENPEVPDWMVDIVQDFQYTQRCAGCMNINAENYNPNAVEDAQHPFEECIYPGIPGCTDDGDDPNFPNRPVGHVGPACNYISNAEINDGSCEYPIDIYGYEGFDCNGQCLDEDHDVDCNCQGFKDGCGLCPFDDGYGEIIDCGNGIEICPFENCEDYVESEEIPGCTYTTASNYNPDATIDDGSCNFDLTLTFGCLDETAFTFDPSVNTSSDSYCNYVGSDPSDTINKSTGEGRDGEVFFRLDLFTMLPYINNMIDFDNGYEVQICLKNYGQDGEFSVDYNCEVMSLPNPSPFDDKDITPYKSYLFYITNQFTPYTYIKYFYKIIRPDGIEISELNERELFFRGVGVGVQQYVVPDVDYFYDYKKSYEGPADYDESSHYGYLCTDDSITEYCTEGIENSEILGNSYFINNPITTDKVSTYLPIVKHTGNMSSGSLEVQYDGPTFKNKLFNSLTDTSTEKINLSNMTVSEENLQFGITKHSYELRLEPENDFSLFGLPLNTQWILDPIVDDFSLIKNQLAREMFFDMGYNPPSGELVHYYQDYFFNNTKNLITNGQGRYTQNYVGFDTGIGCNYIERKQEYEGYSGTDDWSSTGDVGCTATMNFPNIPQYSYRVICDVPPPGISQPVLMWDARNVSFETGEGFNTDEAISYFINGDEACESLNDSLNTSYLDKVFQETYEGVYYLKEQDIGIDLSTFISEDGLNCECQPDGLNCYAPSYNGDWDCDGGSYTEVVEECNGAEIWTATVDEEWNQTTENFIGYVYYVRSKNNGSLRIRLQKVDSEGNDTDNNDHDLSLGELIYFKVPNDFTGGSQPEGSSGMQGVYHVCDTGDYEELGNDFNLCCATHPSSSQISTVCSQCGVVQEVEQIDLPLAIDTFLLSELSLNPQSSFYSEYFNFNYSFQIPNQPLNYQLQCNEEHIYNDNRVIGDHVSYWLFKDLNSDWRTREYEGNLNKSFLQILRTQDETYNSVIERYNELRAPGQVFDIDNIISDIDDKKNKFKNDFFYNFDRWGSFSEIFRTVEIEGYFYDDSLPDVNLPTTYDEEIEYLKQWVEARILWIDHNIRNMKKEFWLEGENTCGANITTPSYCNDSLAINYNPNSNFNDGSCEYTFDPLYTFNVNYDSVNFPEVLEMKLVIVNLITNEERIYDMTESGDVYTIDIFDLNLGDFFEYYYIKYIKNISGLFTGSFETDKPRQVYIYNEQRIDFNDTFNDFQLDFEESELPIVIIDTTRNDCQTDEQYYNGDPGFVPNTPADPSSSEYNSNATESEGKCGFGWYYCPGPYAENELYYFNEIIYQGSYKNSQLFNNFCFYINEENCNDEPTCVYNEEDQICEGVCGTGEQYIYPCEDSDDIWDNVLHPDYYKHRYYENITDCNAGCFVDCIDGETYQDEPKTAAHMKILYKGEGIVNNINDEPQSEHKIGIEVRGFSHRGFAKKQFSIELQDGNKPRPQTDDAELAYSLFCNDFNPEAEVDYEDCYFRLAEDFVVLGPYRDKTMMKNALSYELWRQAGEGQREGRNRPFIKTKYVELIINGKYKGIYVFMDKPEKGNNNRMNINGTEKDSEVVIKVESGAEHGINSLFVGVDGRTKYEYYEPDYKDDELTPLMRSSIKSIVQTAERSIFECRQITDSTQCNDDERCLWDGILNTCNTDLLDINGFIDYYHLQDFALNREGFSRSQYWYFDICKNDDDSSCLDIESDNYEDYDQISKIYMGPTWDFNHAYGSFDNEYQGTTLSEYTFSQPGFWLDFVCIYGYWPTGAPTLWRSYDIEPSPSQDGACSFPNDNPQLDYIGKRYKELRENILSMENVTSYINDNYNIFKENKAIDRDFLRWYRFGRNYDEEMIYFRNWIISRLRERDDNYNLEKNFYWTIYPIDNQEFDISTTNEIEIFYQTNLISEVAGVGYSVVIINKLTGETIKEFSNLDSGTSFYKSFVFDLRNQVEEDLIGEYEIILNTDDEEVDTNLVNFRITDVARVEGCTDTFALNFDIYSEIDDGSCLYREDIEDTIIASTTIDIHSGVNTISYPREFIRLNYNFFEILNDAYEYETCEEKPCFNEFDSVVILNGQKEDESDENVTAVFINGDWVTSGDYGIDVDRYIKIGDGIILYVQQPGVLNL